jgi:hypothetical protein
MRAYSAIKPSQLCPWKSYASDANERQPHIKLNCCFDRAVNRTLVDRPFFSELGSGRRSAWNIAYTAKERLKQLLKGSI